MTWNSIKMSEYDELVESKKRLRFKSANKTKKTKTSKDDDSLIEFKDLKSKNKPEDKKLLEDTRAHGGWWKISRADQIRDDLAIEFLPGRYAKALSNGHIVLGEQHENGDEPEEEEIFTIITTSPGQFAMKSGFGRYLSLNSNRTLMGLSEAVGEGEQFIASFEDSKSAICCSNDRFLRLGDEDKGFPIEAQSTTVGSPEILTLRAAHQIS